MDVIPLTLTASLCLVFTFVIFFLREQSRTRFRSAESDAVLPFAEETGRIVAPRQSLVSREATVVVAHDDHACGCRSGIRPPCQGCLKGTRTV